MKETSWRNFQSDYIEKKKKKDLFLKTLKATIGLCILILLTTGFFFVKNKLPENNDTFHKSENKNLVQTNPQTHETPNRLLTTQLSTIIRNTHFIHTDKNIFFIDTPEESYKVTTSIDIYLQQYLLSLLDKLKK
ncbi:MAG: hypothetical protein DRH34_09810, partial [Deltaproteobacteria bacterium]